MKGRRPSVETMTAAAADHSQIAASLLQGSWRTLAGKLLRLIRRLHRALHHLISRLHLWAICVIMLTMPSRQH
jgi:hypothetical protein